MNGARATRRSRGVSVCRQIIIRKSKLPLCLFGLITHKMADTRLPSPPAIRCGLFPVLQGDPTGFHQVPAELESGTLAQGSDSINRHLPLLFICQDGGSQVSEYFSSRRGGYGSGFPGYQLRPCIRMIGCDRGLSDNHHSNSNQDFHSLNKICGLALLCLPEESRITAELVLCRSKLTSARCKP